MRLEDIANTSNTHLHSNTARQFVCNFPWHHSFPLLCRWQDCSVEQRCWVSKASPDAFHWQYSLPSSATTHGRPSGLGRFTDVVSWLPVCVVCRTNPKVPDATEEGGGGFYQREAKNFGIQASDCGVSLRIYTSLVSRPLGTTDPCWRATDVSCEYWVSIIALCTITDIILQITN